MGGIPQTMLHEQQLVKTLLAEQGRVIAYVQSIVRDPDLADDIFQDVCVLAVEKRAQIQDETHLQKWLLTAARMEALSALRRRKRESLLLDEQVLDAIDASWREQDVLDLTARSDALRRCLSSLSDGHQALVAKRFVNGYDYPRLAAECHRSVSSLYVTFSRIYAFLAKCISDPMSPPAGVRRG